MSFAQTDFLPFLGLAVLVWPFVPARGRAAFLLLASYVFYLSARPVHGLLLAASTLVDYVVALRLGREERPAARRALLWISVVLNIGLLAVFKYAGFAARNWSALTGTELAFDGFALPLGISFYTFQTLSYTIDVYRRKQEPCRNFVDYALFVSFFPQLLAGPIERASHLLPQLRRPKPLSAAALSRGARRILWGLGKKWLVADRLADHIWEVFTQPGGHDSLTLCVVAVGLAVVLYVDFSAYADIAVGSARLFGVELVENFRRPFVSTSVDQYVRRWHISLMTWMFDYVYEPLSRGRLSHARIWFSNVFVMSLFGLWHGAAWTFVFWGLGFGVTVSIGHSLRLARGRRGRRAARRAPSRLGLVGSWFLTLFASCQLMVLFFGSDLGFALDYYLAELTLRLPASAEAWAWLGTTTLVLVVLFVVHASGEWLDLDLLWARIGGVGRTVAWIVGAGLLVRFRVPDPDPFFYFGF